MNRIAYSTAHADWVRADTKVRTLAPWWPAADATQLPTGLTLALERRSMAERNMRTALQMTDDQPGYWDGGRWLCTASLWFARGA